MSDEPSIPPMTRERTIILLHRACTLIMDEWGKTRMEALAWLSDDTHDWTPRPQSDAPLPPDAFIQVTRTTNVQPPKV